MKPRSYGDKLTLDGEVNLRAMSDQEIDSRLAYLIAQAKKPDLRLVEPSEPTPLLPNLGKTPRFTGGLPLSRACAREEARQDLDRGLENPVARRPKDAP